VQTWAAVLTAFGTIGAVLVALFLQDVRARMRRPRLRFEFSPDRINEDVVALDHQIDQTFDLNLKLRVLAQKHRDPALGVRVLLQRVDQPGSTANQEIPSSRELKWSDTDAEFVDIPAGAWRRVDILRLHGENGESGPQRFFWAVLQRRQRDPYPPEERNRFSDPGEYALELVLTANGARPTWWEVTFEYLPRPATSAEDFVGQIGSVAISEITGN